MRKKISAVFGLAFLVLVGEYVWHSVINYNFATIEPGEVYKSAEIPPNKIDSYIKKYHIKTVIDLRTVGEHHHSGNTTAADIQAEATAVDQVPGAHHVSIPSTQVPTAKTLKAFFAVMDNKNSYPVLIHCHDGMGRSVIYSAIYRIEYLHWTDAAARNKTRPVLNFLWYHSAFSKDAPKGRFLMHYKPRRDGKDSTYYHLAHAAS